MVTSTFSDLQKVNHKPRYKAFSKVFLVVCSVPGCVQDYSGGRCKANSVSSRCG